MRFGECFLLHGKYLLQVVKGSLIHYISRIQEGNCDARGSGNALGLHTSLCKQSPRESGLGGPGGGFAWGICMKNACGTGEYAHDVLLVLGVI